MDPITLAIVSATAAGVTTEVGKKVLGSAYGRLKALFKERTGDDSDLMDAVEKLEKKPKSKGRQQTVCEEIESAAIHTDAQVLKVAEQLLSQLKEMPGGQQHIHVAMGQNIAQADRGSTATVNVSQPENPDA